MRRLIVPTALLLFAPSGYARDDYELANTLAQRGWYDLAQELFTRIQNDSSLPSVKRAEGKYGLARMKFLRADRETHPQKKLELCGEAIREVTEFLEGNPDHPRRADALADIGDLHQLKGKTFLGMAKTDAGALAKAEAEFDRAEGIFDKQVAELMKVRPERPNTADQRDNPAKYKRDLARYEAWDKKVMFAKYNKGASMFARADAYRTNPQKIADMKKKLEEMTKLFTEFMWDFSVYLPVYDAAIYLGRAAQYLAETANRAKAEKYWADCFRYIGTAKTPMGDPKLRMRPDVREIGTRGYYYEIRARLAYGDTKKGAAARKQYLEAAKLAEQLFRYDANAGKSEIGKAVLLEQARAYCKARVFTCLKCRDDLPPAALDPKECPKCKQKVKLKGELLLARLRDAKENKGTWVESSALDILGEFVGESDLGLAIESADDVFLRGRSWFYRALVKYRAILSALRTTEDHDKYFARCWYQIGRCYYYLHRFHEAAAAFSVIIYERSPYIKQEIAGEAARMKLNSLKAVAHYSQRPEDRRELDRFSRWATGVREFEKGFGEGVLQGRAIDEENRKNFANAIALWKKLAVPGKPFYEEALFSIGQNHFYLGRRLMGTRPSEGSRHFEIALRTFRDLLRRIKKGAPHPPQTVRNATGAILFSCRIHNHQKYKAGDPLEALSISEEVKTRFPKMDGKVLIMIMSERINAKLRLSEKKMWFCLDCARPVEVTSGQACPTCKKTRLRSYLEEAQKDMATFEAKRKDRELVGVGKGAYLYALGRLAEALEQQGGKLRSTQPALAREFMLKAVDYYLRYDEEEPNALEGDRLLFFAEKLFAIAEEFRGRGDAKSQARAKEYFSKAADKVTKYLAEDRTRESRNPHLRRMITRANIMSGQFEEAIKDLEELTRNDPKKLNGSAWEDLADCYRAKAEAIRPSKDWYEYYKKADGIYAELASALMRGGMTEHFFRVLYGHAACLFHIDPDRLNQFYEAMDLRGYGRQFGCEKCRRLWKKSELRAGKACPSCGIDHLLVPVEGQASFACALRDECRKEAEPHLILLGWDNRRKTSCPSCARKIGPHEADREKLHRLRCRSCAKTYVAGGAIDKDSSCPECRAKGGGLLEEAIHCPACKTVFVPKTDPTWTRKDWEPGPYSRKFEELRKELEKRLSHKRRGN